MEILMEKIIDFKEKSLELEQKELEDEVIYFMEKMYYGLFTNLERKNKVQLFPNNYRRILKGLVYDNCFFALDLGDNYKDNIFQMDLEIMNGISSYNEPGLFVYALSIPFKNDEEQMKEINYILNNLDLLEEIDNYYEEIKDNDSINFNKNIDLFEDYENMLNKPIKFKK